VGGSHSMFTDRPGTGGNQLNPRVKQATKELLLECTFGHRRPWALAQWVERHRAILARHEGAGGDLGRGAGRTGRRRVGAEQFYGCSSRFFAPNG
jgi:hypothetical protein